jgi:hypothetical protein
MDDDNPAIKARRQYGRGFCDGLRSAGVNPEDWMLNKRMKEAEHGLTGIARLIFDAVPIAHAWNADQIASELKRTGKSIERKAIAGCLDTLKALELVSEPERGMYVKRQSRPLAAKVIQLQDRSNEKQPETGGPLDLFLELSGRLRRIADDIDTEALRLVERLESVSTDTQKLRQLQEILKSINSA